MVDAGLGEMGSKHPNRMLSLHWAPVADDRLAGSVVSTCHGNSLDHSCVTT